MRKTTILALTLSAACLLSACNKEEQPKQPAPGEAVVITEPVIDGVPESAYITIDDERIRITSLSVWEEFNHDGNFSDNCLNFLRNFIENDSEYLEFNSVKVSDWEIIRDPEAYDYYSLAFNFTVTESALDTLPVGSYRTIVEDIVDCYMRFEGTDPTAVEEIPPSEGTDAVRDWIASTMRWEMPIYGKATDPMLYTNYIIRRYGENGKMLFSDFQKHLAEKVGISASTEECRALLHVENEQLYIIEGGIGGNVSYAFIADTEAGDCRTVTVQFFADCNRFIRSMRVEYRIGDDGELLGSTVVEKSPFKPYGLQ